MQAFSRILSWVRFIVVEFYEEIILQYWDIALLFMGFMVVFVILWTWYVFSVYDALGIP